MIEIIKINKGSLIVEYGVMNTNMYLSLEDDVEIKRVNYNFYVQENVYIAGYSVNENRNIKLYVAWFFDNPSSWDIIE